ncbi:Uu.00g006510.m01.CDS01 [Anthostomella pinea]|uniref:Uu.00g006510.m01.CDS01 n=1 Tax=Anthostomella pinea TaxID=933095 RepID=A0AAI8VLA9_9PEZI|nr:Uu.00g006510.m01.CDS01 [Anthostomella pinea]
MPSSAVLADEGVKAVQAGRYDEGIAKLSDALKERPAPLWLLERSKAYLRTNDFDLALYDAEKALRVAFDRANRDLMAEAQIRRAVTLFRMGQYADADICASWAIKLTEGAKASEDDGQQKKVDENGNYTVRASEIIDANKPAKGDGLAAAMGGPAGRSKPISIRNQAFSWRLQSLTQLDQLPADHAGRKVTISIKYPTPSENPPTKKTQQKSTAKAAGNGTDKRTEETISHDETSQADPWEKIWKQYKVVYGKNAIRSNFYQTDTTLNIDFFVKNVPKDDFKIHARPESVTLFPVPGTLEATLDLLLFAKVKPLETKHTVKSMKIELVLQKETPGKWPTMRKENAEIIDHIALGTTAGAGAAFNQFHALVTSLGYREAEDLQLPDFGKDQNEWYRALLGKLRAGVNGTNSQGSSDAGVQATSSTQAATLPEQPKGEAMDVDSPADKAAPLAKQTNATKATGGVPAYPTSSKKGPKNWDNLDVDDDEKEEGDVNSFFQKLYKNANEDTKRAMMKSYVESNGTSLSTSWSEAKEKEYKTLPPDGAEAKKWDEQ